MLPNILCTCILRHLSKNKWNVNNFFRFFFGSFFFFFSKLENLIYFGSDVLRTFEKFRHKFWKFLRSAPTVASSSWVQCVYRSVQNNSGYVTALCICSIHSTKMKCFAKDFLNKWEGFSPLFFLAFIHIYFSTFIDYCYLWTGCCLLVSFLL